MRCGAWRIARRCRVAMCCARNRKTCPWGRARNNQMKTKDFSLHVKDVSDEGTFTGYGSIFGNVDAYGEKVMPGAFANSLAKHRQKGTSPLMFWQHNPSEPIGVWSDLAEDGKGL